MGMGGKGFGRVNAQGLVRLSMRPGLSVAVQEGMARVEGRKRREGGDRPCFLFFFPLSRSEDLWKLPRLQVFFHVFSPLSSTQEISSSVGVMRTATMSEQCYGYAVGGELGRFFGREREGEGHNKKVRAWHQMASCLYEGWGCFFAPP